MKKKVLGRKLSRDRDSRRALKRALLASLVRNGAIKTTYAKAKFVQKEAERLMVLAKKESLEARRKVFRQLANNREITDGIFTIARKRFKEVGSGFTRIINLPPRLGDNAAMVRLEWSRQPESSAVIKDIKSIRGKAKLDKISASHKTLKSKLSKLKGGSVKSVKKPA